MIWREIHSAVGFVVTPNDSPRRTRPTTSSSPLPTPSRRSRTMSAAPSTSRSRTSRPARVRRGYRDQAAAGDRTATGARRGRRSRAANPGLSLCGGEGSRAVGGDGPDRSGRLCGRTSERRTSGALGFFGNWQALAAAQAPDVGTVRAWVQDSRCLEYPCFERC